MKLSRFSWIVLAALAAHWPAFLAPSAMWDDWLILAWNGHPEWIWQFYASYGLAPMALIFMPFAYGAGLGFARVVCFLGAMAIGWATMKLTRSAVAGCLAATFPALSGPGFHPTSLIYFVLLPAFLAAFLIRNRVIAGVLLAFSFSLNSLLVFFYGLLPHARRLWPLVALPVVYWLAKETLNPRVGSYAGYNTLKPSWLVLVPCAALLAVAAPFGRRWLLIALAGAAALLPYLLVGRRGFPFTGIMARDSVLLTVPVAWALALTPLRWWALAYFVVFNWFNHVAWQEHYRIYQAAIAQVPRQGILWIDDQLPLGPLNARYPTAIWTAMLGTVAIPYPPADGVRYSAAELEQRLAETQVAFMLPKPSGPQYKVTLTYR